MLKSLMQTARVDLTEFAVTYDIDRMEKGEISSQRWAVAWGAGGFRIDIATPFANSPSFPEDHQVSVLDLDAAHAVIYDGVSTAEVSVSANQLGLAYLMPDYCGFLGCFTTRTLAGGEPLFNDPVDLLGSDEVWVASNETLVGTLNCVVLEWRPAVSGGMTPVLRGYYAIDFGFAQVRLESLRSDGSVGSSWQTTDWLSRGSGSVALPLAGQHDRYGADGTSVAWAKFHVVLDGENPMVSTGATPNLSLTLPTGTAVIDRDTASTRVVTASSPARFHSTFTVSELASGGHRAMSAGSVLLASGVGLCAFSSAGIFVWRHRRRISR
ncbi:MAG: hypothetical protein SGJ09_06680 [Phycisphaerae bacterium]|nr:hypothetical protein [Phycisphaerae bacterium]